NGGEVFMKGTSSSKRGDRTRSRDRAMGFVVGAAVLAAMGAAHGERLSDARFSSSPPDSMETCSPRGPASIPPGYAIASPRMLDMNVGTSGGCLFHCNYAQKCDPGCPARRFNEPVGHYVRWHEGRLRRELRIAAQRKDPLYSLGNAALQFALGDAALANAYADLSVTGSASFEALRRAPKNEADVLRWLRGPPAGVTLPPELGRLSDAQLRSGAGRALDRAYRVAYVLRISDSPARRALRVPMGWI